MRSHKMRGSGDENVFLFGVPRIPLPLFCCPKYQHVHLSRSQDAIFPIFHKKRKKYSCVGLTFDYIPCVMFENDI